MKKEVILIFALFILSTSFVSASFFDKITGRATSNLNCIDSDNGINYEQKGSIKLQNEYSSGEEFEKCTGIGEGIFELVCGSDGCGYAIVYPTKERKNPQYMLIYDNGNCNEATATGGYTYDCSVEDKLCSEGKCVEKSVQKCIPNWECSDWTPCQKFRTSSMNFIFQQTRNCEDKNNCATMEAKPDEIQSCSNPCIEDWSCSEWSACINDKQTRTCEDLENCGTEWDKPIEIKSCEETINEVLISDFLKNDEKAIKIINRDLLDYSIKDAEHREYGEHHLDVTSFAFRFVMGLKQLGYTFVQDTNNINRPLYLNAYYKFLDENNFEQSDIITKEILINLDYKLAMQEKINEDNYENLKELIKLEEVDPSFPNYPSKKHFYSLIYNFWINLPKDIRHYENSILGGQGSDYFLSIGPNFFYPPSDSTYEYNVLKYDCEIIQIIAHEWAHNVEFELILPENQNEIDERFNLFGQPYYKTDKSLDYYSISWTNNTNMINKGFVTSYGMYHEGDATEYPHPAEDLAEHFSMYVTQGEIFRYLASRNIILQQKYNWLKDNAFKGIEYDTGNPNFMEYIPDNSDWTNEPYNYFNDVIDYSIEDFNYKCMPIKVLENKYELNQSSESILSSEQTEVGEEKIKLISCDEGCMTDNKCIPISIRINNYYCSLNQILENQKSSDEQCENNFECISNICIDNKCVDTSIWNKFISWFRNLFS